MKLKLDDQGHAALSDGKPVYVFEDGKESPFDVPEMYERLSRDGRRNSDLQKTIETAEAKLKAFDGLDAAAARTALDTVKNLDLKKLVDAGEIDKVKQEAVRAMEEKIKAVEARISPIEQERDSFRNAFHGEKIGNAFANSKYIADKLAIPSDVVQAMFAKNIKFEDAGVVGYDAAGNKLYSRAKPGDLAPFDEALELLVESYPNRERILKGSGANGGGAKGGGNGGKRTVSRAQFDKMDPVVQSQTALAAGKGEVVLVD